MVMNFVATFARAWERPRNVRDFHRLATVATCWSVVGISVIRADEPTIDPATWGADHVGQEFPDYLTGDECLFCHRNIGPTWDANPHQRTFRRANSEAKAIGLLQKSNQKFADETQLLLGAKRMTRFLRKSKDYGKLELLSAKYVPDPRDTRAAGKLTDSDSAQWNTSLFADRCAGCHTTAVDTQSRTFSTISLDCVTCHGVVEIGHEKDVSQVFLSSKNREPNQIISICGQCHLRGGKSKSSGLPYPNTFVAGDNLFRDFEVTLTDEATGKLPTIEQHIYLNVRDIAFQGRTADTCISCHDVHGNSSDKHQDLDSAAICASCHKPNTDNSELLDSLTIELNQRQHNKTCAY